jgi:hypothetical protein
VGAPHACCLCAFPGATVVVDGEPGALRLWCSPLHVAQACPTKAVYEALLFTDVLGIWLLGTAISVTIVGHGFLTAPIAAKLCFLVVVQGWCLVRLWRAKSARDRALSLSVQTLFRLLLNLLRLGCGAYGAVGSASSWLLPTVHASSGQMLVAELAMVLAGFVNVVRFPERQLGAAYPVLDVVGNSHHLMHVIAVGCIYLSYQACVMDCDVIAADPVLQSVADAQADSLAAWLPFGL